MKRIFAIAALAACGSATAQDNPKRADRDAVLEVTMALIPANTATVDVVTARIELPKGEPSREVLPSAQGAENAAPGLDAASLARENGRAFGEAAAAAARDNRENAGRGSTRR